MRLWKRDDVPYSEASRQIAIAWWGIIAMLAAVVLLLVTGAIRW